MRAAIYCRKSNAQDGATEEKSVASQERACRTFCEKQGWTVDDAHLYVDDGVSGALFTREGRPSFFRLIDAASSKARPFDVVVVAHEDRLGRDAIHTAYILKQLIENGVRLFSADGTERKLESATDVLMLNIAAFASAFERERAQTRVRDKFFDKVKRGGQHTGGNLYGYALVKGDGFTDLKIDPDQAAVVVRIFTLHVQGHGIKRIASLLNAEGVPGPGSKRNGRTATTWSATGLRDMLRNEKYAGVVTYGRTRRAMKQGAKVRRDTDAGAWVRVEREDLRIVPENLWQANLKRVAATAATFLRRKDGTVDGRPETLGAGVGKYLLSGLLACGTCGGTMIAIRRTGKNKRRTFVYYVCGTARTRGHEGCSNHRGLRADDIEGMLIHGFERVVLTPEAVETVLADAAQDRAEGLCRRVPGAASVRVWQVMSR